MPAMLWVKKKLNRHKKFVYICLYMSTSEWQKVGNIGWDGGAIIIADPENQSVTFTVSDLDSPASSLIVTATSTNQAVVPNANLTLTRLSAGTWTLALDPRYQAIAWAMVSPSPCPSRGRIRSVPICWKGWKSRSTSPWQRESSCGS